MLKLTLTRSQREKKTAYIAARVGETAFFVALHYDLRHLLRYAAAALAVLAALRRGRK